MYEPKSIVEMQSQRKELAVRLDELMYETVRVSELLRNDEAKNHLVQGVGRRLKIIARCIEQLFLLLPPDAMVPLERDQLTDLTINIHAMLVNVAGLLDDLAWVFAYESADAAKFEADHRSVGLFKARFQAVLPVKLLAHLKGKTFSAWYDDYAKDYRDAVAHHIPPYVAERVFLGEDGRKFEELNKAINALLVAPRFDYKEAQRLSAEQDKLGVPALAMNHAFSGRNRARPMLFHAQAICDGLTICELMDIALTDLKSTMEDWAKSKADRGRT